LAVAVGVIAVFTAFLLAGFNGASEATLVTFFAAVFCGMLLATLGGSF